MNEPSYFNKNEYVQADAYVKMSDNQEYILFLRQGDTSNEYGVTSIGFGKYSITGKSHLGKLSEFNKFGEIKKYDFISDDESFVNYYSEIKKNVLKKYIN
ncbi:hypothetical protein [Gottfriedia luciferensis]|uniref:hypothetical protein n=1 Tax=Gottfriedia luciferensis TaxID=178774 RepID=UPI000B445EBD|nr:hypothetical protein [Gottfriedia luciferensis]